MFYSFSKQRAASLTELALAIPVLFLLIVVIIDVGRYIAVRQLARAGLQEGLSYAAKLDGFKVDLLAPDSSINQHSAFYAARTAAIAESTRLGLETMIRSWDEQPPPMVHYVRCILAESSLGAAGRQANAAILQPGQNAECDGAPIHHPELFPREGSATLESLLKKYPLYGYAAVDFRWLIPIFPKQRIIVEASAFAKKGEVHAAPTAEPTSGAVGTPDH